MAEAVTDLTFSLKRQFQRKSTKYVIRLAVKVRSSWFAVQVFNEI